MIYATLSRREGGMRRRRGPAGPRRLVDGDPILVLELFVDWGYTYQAATPPNYDNGVVTVAEF